ncbi:molybdate ABC transporter substrate-binding protein [Corynebacterium gerontici]|uniref:Molybdate-binding periplasmic protein n=1 Tax=Corynebacterium gerontici TaxID=2079234 RepID=A0A3G6J2M1_9CORY|nr:molybdate ABC transporter substrate-binding protein [Corynebacterium gerontici]AZA11218.1 Molybdate-binding periplasmic protein precursor [Corynebacterium gerontici]
MKRIMPVAAALMLLQACAQYDSLQVFGAASTRLINEDLAAAIDASLSFNNAGSSALVQQIAEGAEADVLITANEQTMKLAQSNVAAPRAVASNDMVLIVPKGNPAKISSFSSLDHALLVICDANVPCGDTTAQLAKANGVTLKPASLEQSVSDVLGKVISQEADAGVVYRTDAAAASEQVEVIEIPHAEEFKNTIMAAVVKNSSKQKAAAGVVEKLDSASFDEVWQRYGFIPSP